MVSIDKLEDLEKKILTALGDMSNLKSENTMLSGENRVLKKQLNSFNEKLKAKEEELSGFKLELGNTEAQISKIKSTPGHLDVKIDSLNEKLNEYYGKKEKKIPETISQEKQEGKNDDKNIYMTTKENNEKKNIKNEKKSYSGKKEVEKNKSLSDKINTEFNDDDFGDIVIID